MNKRSHLKDVSAIVKNRVRVQTKRGGEVVSLNISEKKGQKKSPVKSLRLVKAKGVELDAHYGTKRQLSLLPYESIRRMKQAGIEVGPGSFAENITIKNIETCLIKIGSQIKIGEALIEITHIGKDCHSPCAIYEQAGYCVMPTDGVFAKILTSGEVKTGDLIEVIE